MTKTIRGIIRTWCDADIMEDRGTTLTFDTKDVRLAAGIGIVVSDCYRQKRLIYHRKIYIQGLDFPILIYSEKEDDLKINHLECNKEALS